MERYFRASVFIILQTQKPERRCVESKNSLLRAGFHGNKIIKKVSTISTHKDSIYLRFFIANDILGDNMLDKTKKKVSRWDVHKVSKEVLSANMRAVAVAKWSGMSEAERKEHGAKMTAGRLRALKEREKAKTA